MGWNAKMESGIVLRQSNGLKFTDLKIDQIEVMWLDNLENIQLNKYFCPGFVEFVQFETAEADLVGVNTIAQFIGYSDGDLEYLIGMSKEKHNFHPETKIK